MLDDGNRRLTATEELSEVVRAQLLVLLGDHAGHGFDLLRRLQALGIACGTANRVYYALRCLERDGLVQSNWDTGGVGPARRIYELSQEGLRALEIQSADVRRGPTPST